MRKTRTGGHGGGERGVGESEKGGEGEARDALTGGRGAEEGVFFAVYLVSL